MGLDEGCAELVREVRRMPVSRIPAKTVLIFIHLCFGVGEN
jgi:hypothetical protein